MNILNAKSVRHASEIYFLLFHHYFVLFAFIFYLIDKKKNFFLSKQSE